MEKISSKNELYFERYSISKFGNLLRIFWNFSKILETFAFLAYLQNATLIFKVKIYKNVPPIFEVEIYRNGTPHLKVDIPFFECNKRVLHGTLLLHNLNQRLRSL